MYLKENFFDKIFEKASNRFGLQVGLLKAICAIESEFEPRFEGGIKFGLAGLIRTAPAMVGMGDVSIGEMMEPEVTITILAKILRQLYHSLDNPNMMDVIREFQKLNGNGRADYVVKCFSYYMYFSQKAGEPYSSRPDEVPGVVSRKGVETGWM